VHEAEAVYNRGKVGCASEASERCYNDAMNGSKKFIEVKEEFKESQSGQALRGASPESDRHRRSDNRKRNASKEASTRARA
jgi:hypothetical protein